MVNTGFNHISAYKKCIQPFSYSLASKLLQMLLTDLSRQGVLDSVAGVVWGGDARLSELASLSSSQ